MPYGGSAGAAVILGSYNEGLNDLEIKKANVNGVFVARAMRTMNGDDDDFGKAIGLVDTVTCMTGGTLDLSAHVDNLVMANLGADDNSTRCSNWTAGTPSRLSEKVKGGHAAAMVRIILRSLTLS